MRNYATKSLLVCALILLNATVHASPEHESAVQLARTGKVDPAIKLLEALLVSDPDISIRYDLAVILTWAKRYQDAISIWEQLPKSDISPSYVRTAIIEAYVDNGEFNKAIALGEQGLRQEPDSAQSWLNMATINMRRGERITALRLYFRAQKIDPNNAKIQSGILEALNGLGAFNAEYSRTKTPNLNLLADRAAVNIRWAKVIEPVDQKQRFRRIDRAIEELDALISQAKESKVVNEKLLRQLRMDRVVALNERNRWNEVVAEVEDLRESGPIPIYVLQALADAYSGLRLPEKARSSYQTVIDAEPTNMDAKWGLFFAQTDSNDYAAAFVTVDGIVSSYSPSIKLAKDPTPQPNVDWLYATTMAAVVRSWADMPSEAWDRLKPLADHAPASAGLRSALGSVAAARGWPRLSEQEQRIAGNLDPQSKTIQIELADSAIRRAQWTEARERIASLQDVYPNDQAVRRVARDLKVHDSYELQLKFENQDQNGAALYAPGSGYTASARLYSPSLAENWRVFTDARRMTASIPEQAIAIRNAYGLGASYQSSDFTAEGAVWANTGDVNKNSASLRGAWLATDEWRVDAGAALFAMDTPLRALYYGITANSADIGASYTWNESRSIGAQYKVMNFTDGNFRQIGALNFNQRIYQAPQTTVTLKPSIYTSTNTLQNVPYYSPQQDLSVTLGLAIDNTLWRRDQNVFGHHIEMSAGNYTEANYAGGLIWDVRYQQFYRRDPFTEINYGVAYNRRIYDGTPEKTFFVFANLVTRF